MLFEGEDELNTDGGVAAYVPSKEDDFFFAFSTVEGYVSYRDPKKGTVFLQTVCNVWEEDFYSTPLVYLMDKVKKLKNKKRKNFELERF